MQKYRYFGCRLESPFWVHIMDIIGYIAAYVCRIVGALELFCVVVVVLMKKC